MKPLSRWLGPSPTGWTLLLLVAVGLRAWKIDRLPPGLWMDEARNLSEVSTFISNHHWQPGWICGQPAYGVPAALTCLVFGKTPMGLRLASVLCGVLTIPALYFFARSITSRRIAWLAAWLLAVSGWHVIFSRIGFRAILLPLAIALCGWALAEALRRPSAGRWLLLGAACGLAWHTYFAFWLLPPLVFAALVVGMFVKPAWRARWGWGAAAALGVFLLLAGGWMILLYARTGALLSSRVSDTSALGSVHSPMEWLLNVARALWMFVWKGDLQPRHNIPGWPAWPVFLAPFLVAAIAAAALRPTPARLALWALWVATLLPTILTDSCPHHLRALGNLVPTCILTADGLVVVAATLARKAPRAACSALLATLIAAATGFGAWSYFGVYARQPALRFAFQAKECDLARHVRDHVAPDRPVVFLNLVYGRVSVETLLAGREHVTFLSWPLGAPVPPLARSASRRTVWAVPRENLVRLDAIRGIPVTLADFGPADGSPEWSLVEYVASH